jgi:hypothetical protein
MKPEVAVNIIDRDRTGPGQRSAERKLSGFAARTREHAKKSGLSVIGEQIERIAKLGRMDYSLEGLGRGLRGIGRASGEMREGLEGATSKAIGLGGIAETAFGGVAEAAGVAVGAIAGLVTVTGAAGVAAYMLGDKWAKVGGEVERTSKGLAMTAGQLQGARAANERYGVSTDATTSSLDALQTTLYDASSGANNLALGALTQLDIKIRKNKDGVVDLNQAYMDLADGIARQKDPAVQKKLAAIFGLSAALPALRQGSAKLKAESGDYLSTTAALTPEQARAAEETERKAVILRQRLGGIEKAGGVEAMKATGAIADSGRDKAEAAARAAANVAKKVSGFAADPASAVSAIADKAKELAHSGAEAGHSLVAGAKEAGRALRDAIPPAIRDPAAQMMSFLEGRGFSSHQAQGMTAGAFAESRLDPSIVNPKSGAFGIGQWLGDRKKALFERYGAHPSFQQQLEFMAWELAHTERSAGAALRGAPSATAALDTYVTRFMRPAKGGETSGDIQRGQSFLTSPKAHVTVSFKNLPPGAVVRSAGAPGVQVDTDIVRAMDGP